MSTADPQSARPATAVPLISVIVVTYGTGAVVGEALDAVAHCTAAPHEVIVVDNPVLAEGSQTLQLLRARDDIVLVEAQSNLGFAGGNELGVRHASGEYLCFLNPDVIVGPGWIEPLVDALADPIVGIAATVLRNPDGSLQEAGQLLYDDGCTAAIGGPEILTGDEAQVFSRDVDYASAACWVVRRAEHIARGGFDLRYHPAFFEDVDYALRVEREGKRTRLVADVPVVHHHGQGGAGKSLELGETSREVFRSIWSDRLGEQLARPSTAVDAVRSRDRLAERTTVFSAPSEQSTNERRRRAFGEAVALAASRQRERVTFLADDSTGLDLAGARSAGLEVVIAEPPLDPAERPVDECREIRSPVPSPRRRYGFVAAAVLVAILGLVTRFVVLRSPAARFGSDEAYTGIQAFEILGGNFPVVLGGTVYTLPFESYLYAPIQAAFGSHIVALRLLSTLSWAGASIIIFLIGRVMRGRRMGAIAAALLWLAPGAMLLLSVTAYESYSSGMLVTLVTFLLALRILDSEHPSRWSMALFGASAGFAFWLHPMFLATLIPMVVVVLLAQRKRLDAWWSVILGGVAGCSPFLLWNVLNGWPSLEAPVKVEGTYTDRLSTFVRDLFPRTFGLRDGALQWQPGEVLAQLLYVALILGVVYGVVVVARRPGRPASRFLLPAVLIAVLPIMALFQNLIFALDGRYGVIAFPFLVVALAAGIDELAGRELGPRTVGVLGVVGLVWLGALIGPTLRNLADLSDSDPNVTTQAILDRLEDAGITEIYGSYWSVLPVEFSADEEITAGVVARWPVRFPERQRVVEATPPEEVAFLFKIADEDPTSLWLPAAEYERDVIGDNVLYLPTVANTD